MYLGKTCCVDQMHDIMLGSGSHQRFIPLMGGVACCETGQEVE